MTANHTLSMRNKEWETCLIGAILKILSCSDYSLAAHRSIFIKGGNHVNYIYERENLF